MSASLLFLIVLVFALVLLVGLTRDVKDIIKRALKKRRWL